MKSTLIDLWHGNISPIEEKAENNDKDRELHHALEGYYNSLWGMLDDKGKQMLGKLKDCHIEILYSKNEDAFVQGFSLAIKLMTESLAD